MMAEFFKHGDQTVSMNGLRNVMEIRANPSGGAPHRDGGILTYEDGTQIDTSLEFAVELAKALPKVGEASRDGS